MQKSWARLVFAVSIAYSGAVEAAYVIKLRSGKEFITARYWYEGTQVMFDLNGGGVFGIDRSSVTTIEEYNKPANPIPTVESSREAKPQPAAKEEKESSPAGAKAEIKRDEDPVLRDFDALKEKSKGLNGMLTSELQEFSKDVQNFKRRIQLSGKSNDYLQEYAAAFKMADEVQAALNARRQ